MTDHSDAKFNFGGGERVGSWNCVLKFNFAGSGARKKSGHAKKSRFAGTICADQRYKFSRRYFQREAAQRHVRSVAFFYVCK
jgi:hypothetical protein